MKTNDIFIGLSALAYTFLFYQQLPGFNFLIFSILLVLLFMFREKNLLLKPAWLAAACGTIISSFSVFWWGTDLTVLANMFSILLLAGLSFSPETSLLIAVLNSAASTTSSVFIDIIDSFSKNIPAGTQTKGMSSIWRKIIVVCIALSITLVFYFIYRSANPVFKQFTDKIDFDFLTFDWLMFLLLGFILMYGAFNQARYNILRNEDNTSGDKLPFITADQHQQSWTGRWLSANSELLTGVILLGLLNALLLVVNSLDGYYMWIVNKLPAGITIAEYLHDGTDTLIFSIILAISVLLFVFRGYLNYIQNNRLLKWLAYVWVAQNIILVVTTAQRNWWIIESSGLTRRRIGIFVYLLLCLIGLSTTFIKVQARKSNWFLFRKNAWAFYAVFIFSCPVNWDDFIIRYNYVHLKTLQFEYIDRSYQVQLGNPGLATLFEYYKEEIADTTNAPKAFTPQATLVMFRNYERLKKTYGHASWKSYCVCKSDAIKKIDDILKNGLIINTSPYSE